MVLLLKTGLLLTLALTWLYFVRVPSDRSDLIRFDFETCASNIFCVEIPSNFDFVVSILSFFDIRSSLVVSDNACFTA